LDAMSAKILSYCAVMEEELKPKNAAPGKPPVFIKKARGG